ncbi:Vms1/Ankzf1 family peptidyl-tRNA hydrolase [Amycolatopsis rhabdoformis]|uniref:Vms1/Ankzf1 family peptidyl-tRNA hydrolase n=1 Tax=Amycolatopsis rhabdoformis TaxID=1448059 RepID=A0ABZ1IGQ8_9PSEU|nr:Vms1/Ankzf1 family peptidyl-tRNA hydrolase [Amycolatopsis rhabdoformis]WSE33276.1 Vms1/Ankzf1 family peptidyl-tRNA hydrolase [Amycolatopsis rhabdoformis]
MDTSDLRPLTTATGPFASVHLDESHDTEDAAKQLRLRLKEICAALSEQDADPATVEAIVAAIEDTPPPVGAAGRSIVAAHGEVVADRRLSAPPGEQEARYSDLPYFLPVVLHAGDAPEHLVVLVDRHGADVEVHHPDGTVHTETAQGSEDDVHKVRGGGPEHRSLRSRAEEAVRHNLEEVAAHVAKTVQHTGAGLVVLAGEVQARAELLNLLPEPVRAITEQSDSGGRAAGADRTELDEYVRELLIGRRLGELDDLAERFHAETGRGSGLAVSGLEAVTAALSEANVATLLVGDPGDAHVLTGPEPTQVGVAKPRLAALGAGDPSAHRADEALPFAAVAVGADVVVMDERLDLQDGFAALLRHA